MKAIDIHVHPPTNPATVTEQSTQTTRQMREYFRRTEPDLTTPEEYAEFFEERDIVAVLLLDSRCNRFSGTNSNR